MPGDIVRRRHLPALQATSRCRDRRGIKLNLRKRGKVLRENVPEATPMQNWAELLALPEIDIVWIGTPPYMHSAVTISALEAGKHVFCQARMAMDLAEAEEMLAASRRFPELVTMLCPPPFGMRGDLLVKKSWPKITWAGCTTSGCKFNRSYLDADAAGALAAADRDQRT